MKLIKMIIFIVAANIAIFSYCQQYYVGGSSIDTFHFKMKCPESWYKYTIFGSTLQVPDRFYVYDKDFNLIFDTYWIPCNSFSVLGEPCRNGFLVYDNGSVSIIDSLPPEYPLSYLDSSSAFRLQFETIGDIYFVYHGNKHIEATVAVFSVSSEMLKDTLYITDTVSECEYKKFFGHGECRDTIFNYIIKNIEIQKDTTLCEKDTLFLDGDGKFYDSHWRKISYLIAQNNTTIYQDLTPINCNDTVRIHIKVINPTYQGDTIFLRKYESVPPQVNGNIYYEDKDGCIFSRKVEIVRINNYKIYIPNAFSPNGDGINDVFFIPDNPYVKEIKEVLIFDRWGGLVHRGNYWDGGEFNTGTFVVVCRYVNAFGEDEEEYSSLHLLR